MGEEFGRVHGDSDTFVPTEMVHTLYENSPVEKELYIVPKAGHGEAFHMDPVQYESVVNAFIEKFVK